MGGAPSAVGGCERKKDADADVEREAEGRKHTERLPPRLVQRSMVVHHSTASTVQHMTAVQLRSVMQYSASLYTAEVSTTPLT